MNFKFGTKRIMSLMLCAAMLLSCMVFTAPGTAAANVNEKYNYTLTIETTDTADMQNNTTQEISLSGKGVNGTGVEAEIFHDSNVDSGYFSNKNTYTQSGTTDLFPTKVSVHVHFGTAAFWVTRNWTGTITLKANGITIESFSMTLVSGNWGTSEATGTVEVSSANFPVVKSVVLTKTPDAVITIPRTDETNKSFDVEAVALDQYETIWHEAPNYALLPNRDGVELAGGKLTVKSNANTDDGSDFNFEVAASSGTVYNTFPVKLINAEYTYVFKNEQGEPIASGSLKYGVTPPLPEEPTKASDKSMHYSFLHWTPLVKALTRDMVYTPVFTGEGHEFAEYIPDDNATCLEDGTKTATCVCGYMDTVVIPETALGHEYTSQITTPPTCTENGVETFTCIRGDHSYTVSLSATGHDYEETVVDPTCTEQGYTNHICTACQNAYQTDFVAPTGHTYDDGAVEAEPTCTEDGVMLFTCIHGDDSYTEAIPALDHDYEGWIVTENPTCTQEGSKYSPCRRCEKTITESIPATGHMWSDWTVESVQSCTTEGRKVKTCANCPEVIVDTEPAWGHDMVLKHEAPDDGITGCIYFQCSHCKLINACEVNAQGEPERVESETGVSLTEIQEESVIPATSFNTYVREDETDYNYVDRGASLKVDETLDEYTQPMRFTASMLIPQNVTVLDFGYIYTRQDKLINLRDFVIGGPFVYDFSFKNGNSTDHMTDEGIVKTFNIVIRVDQNNWDKTYVARPYITYSYAGFTFTVYDQCYADNSVDNIAEAVMYSDEESDYVKEYIQNKIINR